MEENGITSIFFDVGNVLFGGFQETFLQSMGLKYGITPKIIQERGEIEAWKKFKTGDCSEEEYFTEIYTRLGIEINCDEMDWIKKEMKFYKCCYCSLNSLF